jgi:serine/threonine-protein kinase
MTPADARLFAIATAVSDGAPVDWVAAESSASDDGDRLRIRHLRVLAQIIDIHSSDPPGASVGELLDSIRGANPPGLCRADPIRWGPLSILEKVGRGRFGDVYRAFDPRLAREVALKLLRHRRAGEDDLGPAVIEEGRLMARVRHPNVVTIYGAELIEGRVGLWMEFVRGRTLEEELAARGPFGWIDAAHVGIELCQALAAVHRTGLVHRDVKAQNVLRGEDGRVALADFGTGREVDEAAVAEADHELAGTPLYLAPELFRAERATPASDVYSAGVVLYHLVTGSYPVRGRTLGELKALHEEGAKVPLLTLRPELPDAFATVIERALASEPASRFEDADVMARALTEALVEPVAQSAPAEPTLAPAPVGRGRARWLLLATSLTVGLVILAALAAVRAGLIERLTGSGASEASSLFKPRDWLLVTRVENRTGEALFDDSVEHALAREIEASSFLNIVPQERVDDGLRLMRKPAGTPVDLGLGSELAARDGGIKLVLAGRIDRFGPAYALAVRLVEPASGRVLATFADEAVDQAGVLRAIRRVASRVRAALGETSGMRLQESDLERVTTPSLRALKLYSQAMRLAYERKNQAMRELLAEAIEQDPEFASAHILLAHALRNAGGPADVYLPVARRAFELTDRTTEAERYFIRGSYLEMASDRGRAIAAYEALLGVDPDHYWGTNNLMHLYRQAGRGADALRLEMRLGGLRPTDFRTQSALALDLVHGGRVADARAVADRARKLVRPEDFDRLGVSGEVAWLELFPAHERWVDGDVAESLRLVNRMAATLPSRRGDDRDQVAHAVRGFYETLGRFQDADRVAREAPGERTRYHAVLVALGRGDRELLRTRLQIDLDRFRRPALWAHAGFAAEARAVLRRWNRPEPPFGGDVALGEIALAEGRVRDAIRHLRAGTESFRNLPPEYFLGIEALATAHRLAGEPAQAIAALEEGSLQRVQSYTWRSHMGTYWLRIRARLAAEYRLQGRPRDADAIDEEVRLYLRVADSDHPILQRLDHERHARR